MLLEFEVENYKTFKDKIKFSMIPAPKQKGLDYSVLHSTVEYNDPQFLEGRQPFKT